MMVNSNAGAGDQELWVSVENNSDGFRYASRTIAKKLDAWNVGERARYAVELVLEELLTNVIRYGYQDSLTHYIDISMKRDGNEITLVMEDDGRAFDPTAPRPTTGGGNLEDATIGGRGIIMTRKMVHSMHYKYLDHRNRIEFTILNNR